MDDDDDWLVDDDAVDDAVVRAREHDVLRERFQDVGYREGRDAGQENTLQTGFNEAFASAANTAFPDGFHRGAAEIFRLLAATPFASETRESLDTSRTLEQAVQVFAELAAKRDGRPER